eukprot:748822-Hanusia_phi.AAC.2
MIKLLLKGGASASVRSMLLSRSLPDSQDAEHRLNGLHRPASRVPCRRRTRSVDPAAGYRAHVLVREVEVLTEGGDANAQDFSLSLPLHYALFHGSRGQLCFSCPERLKDGWRL